MASRNRFTLMAAGAAVALVSMGCAQADDEAAPPPESPGTEAPGTEAHGTETTDEAPERMWSASGTLETPDEASDAFTYDTELAPVGAQLTTMIATRDGSTVADMTVVGLAPDRGYAAHLHTNACGPEGADAGPHFQHQVDPAATPEEPSTDPAYANPENEFWLDVETDAAGSGTASTEVPFVLTDDVPESLVIHAEPETATGPGEAGTAGDRVACLTIPTE